MDALEEYLDRSNSRDEARMEQEDVMQAESLPRLEDVTTEYLDNIARRLREDTFSEQAKQTYDQAWQQHYAQLETAAIMFHGDGNDLTLCCKLIDSRIRNLEYELDALEQYGERVNDEIRDVSGTDPEIIPLQLQRLTERRDRLRDQYMYIRNMHMVLLTKVRPEIERRTGYTMDAYKSRKTLADERHQRQWRPKRKALNMDQWQSWSESEKQAYLDKNAFMMTNW